MKSFLLSLLLLLGSNALTTRAQDTPVVRTTGGRVTGILQEGTMAFLGIPYAHAERFMPPQPVRRWKDVRQCDHYGPQKMQTNGQAFSVPTSVPRCCL